MDEIAENCKIRQFSKIFFANFDVLFAYVIYFLYLCSEFDGSNKWYLFLNHSSDLIQVVIFL